MAGLPPGAQLRLDLVDARLRRRPAALDGTQTAEVTTAAVTGVDALETTFARYLPQLALGVVVVQASARSGALITARLAGEQDRSIGPDHVPYVGEVAPGVEVADADDGRTLPAFDHRHLTGEGRRRERERRQHRPRAA